MKWQAIANVTLQLNEKAKYYLNLKLQKDAASEIPGLWSDFLIDTNKQLNDSEKHIEIKPDDKTGGLTAKIEFNELHQDYRHNNKSLIAYIINKYDQRSALHLARSKNGYTRQILAEIIQGRKLNTAIHFHTENHI